MKVACFQVSLGYSGEYPPPKLMENKINEWFEKNPGVKIQQIVLSSSSDHHFLAIFYTDTTK